MIRITCDIRYGDLETAKSMLGQLEITEDGRVFDGFGREIGKVIDPYTLGKRSALHREFGCLGEQSTAKLFLQLVDDGEIPGKESLDWAAEQMGKNLDDNERILFRKGMRDGFHSRTK